MSLSDGGYLDDPDSKLGQIRNPDVVPFESIADIPCLGLLGEPGIGKTKTMQAKKEFINTQIKEEGNQSLWLDLRSCGSEYTLFRKLFDSETFVSWVKGKHRLHVFLDSLDECLLRIDNISALLIDELKFQNSPIERLYLRIACRTADWPNGLENGLNEIWGGESVDIYELAPLRRIDVVEAVKANNLDSDYFLSEVDRRGVVSFAIKPVTLNFLINTYRQKGQLPPTQAELYLDGCRILCEEPNENRRDAKLLGDYTAEQRMAIASRIAAITIFANRYAIWTGVDQGDVPEEDITIRKLYGRSENVDNDHFQVTEAAVRETLDTGLFSSRGQKRMGWAHQTYAEFLAARYLVQHRMTKDQIMNLIVHPGDFEGKLVPQLHETAAWLANMEPDVFQKIMKIEPEVLLRSDVASADVKNRTALVDNLLRLYDEEKLLDPNLYIRSQYRKLAHPDLSEQLRPYICDKTNGIIVRRVAINIAKVCELQSLQSNLLDIALDTSQSMSIRPYAADAVSHIGDDKTKVKLKPLAMGEIGDKPYDELKGCALLALWPNHMTIEELFVALTPPKKNLIGGSYWQFLSQDFVQYLQPSDLPVALKWIEKQPSREELSDNFIKCIDKIMLQAWNHIDLPGVLEAFTKAALSRLKHGDEIRRDGLLKSMLKDSNEERHRVLEAMLHLISDSEELSVSLVYSSITPAILSKDFQWMIERLQTSTSKQLQQAWATLIRLVFDWHEPSQSNAILIACQDNPILAETFASFIETIELNSPEAQKIKEDHLEQQRWQESQEKEEHILEPPPSERIIALLDECESGNLTAWWHLNQVMTLEPHSTHYGDELESDLTVLPGWKDAEPTIRDRIIETAKRYLLEHNPETNKWLGTNTIYRPAYAGYRALCLLLREDSDFILTIPVEVWKKWAPIILAYPTRDSTNEKIHGALVKIAYHYAPDEIIKTLMTIIDKENAENGYPFIIHVFKDCWDEQLANALMTKLKDEKLKPQCMGRLLSELLDHRVDEAKPFAKSLISLPLISDEDKRSKSIVAARVLMEHAEDAGWSIVWPVIQQDIEFGKEVITALADSTVKFEQRLTEDQLADLYIWLAHHYPYSEDPELGDAFCVTPRVSIRFWKNKILQHIKGLGTPQACEAIQRIIGELPELDWLLKEALIEAQNITRHRTWVPVRPDDIIEIASNEQARLVQNGEQLLDVLIESLRRLEAKLQGEAAVNDLWNEDVYKPKDENSFSYYVKRHLDDHLKQRGVIVNREVEIRRGERTDIHVDAVTRIPNGEVYDSVTVIIEAKGCWHQELNDAMKTQLVNRYLKDNQCQHGLYLIGWFNCNQWDDNDYRKKQTPKLSIDEAQKKFDAQANELSQQGMLIKAFVLNTALRSEESTASEIGEININSASSAELALLNGIGTKTAELIIAGRPYRKVDDLLNVQGIGKNTLAKFRDKVTLE